jgi:hypothetical protein
MSSEVFLLLQWVRGWNTDRYRSWTNRTLFHVPLERESLSEYRSPLRPSWYPLWRSGGRNVTALPITRRPTAIASESPAEELAKDFSLPGHISRELFR